MAMATRRALGRVAGLIREASCHDYSYDATTNSASWCNDKGSLLLCSSLGIFRLWWSTVCD